MAQETGARSQVESYKDSKNGTRYHLANTLHYKVRFKGKEQHPPLHLSVVAIEKGASTTVTNFTFDCSSTRMALALNDPQRLICH